MSERAETPEPASDEVPEFKPGLTVWDEAGVSEIVLRDCFMYEAEEVTVRVLRDADKNLVGFKWWTADIRSGE